jgi:uncharacterized membrane protein YhaH (DUF805 family)
MMRLEDADVSGWLVHMTTVSEVLLVSALLVSVTQVVVVIEAVVVVVVVVVAVVVFSMLLLPTPVQPGELLQQGVLGLEMV